jgi:excisionase family DNA binding protein
MLTTKEAAAVLGIQPRTVTRYILRGLIHAEKHGRDYFISHDEIERFKQERRKPGNPGTPRTKEQSHD